MISKSHRAFIRMNGRLISKTFRRKTDADRWYQEMKREKELVESGMADDLKTQTVGEFVRAWLETRRANGQPLSSYAQEESRMRLYVLPKFESRDLDSVATTEWERFLDELVLVHEASPATRNRVRAMLSKLYSDAMRMRVVRGNPIGLIPKLKEKAIKWDYFKTTDDCAKYLSEAKRTGSGFYAFACLALNTGMRLGEILALHFEDIDLARRRIRIWRIVEAASDDVCERTKGFTERGPHTD
ncbi:MAG TPA: tyrosine-type recombinase/integrase, partial [Bdellovibrionales bacterium]|nr:tyrosine-type recombinase/integrase [Bdellovibrionales bacterium]